MRFWRRPRAPRIDFIGSDHLLAAYDLGDRRGYERAMEEIETWHDYGSVEDDELDRDAEIVGLDALDDWEDDDLFDVAMLKDELDDLDFLPEVVA